MHIPAYQLWLAVSIALVIFLFFTIPYLLGGQLILLAYTLLGTIVCTVFMYMKHDMENK